MTWIAVLLIGVALSDLAHSVRPAPLVNELVGAVVAVTVGLLAGLTEPVDLVALGVIALAVLGYGQSVTRAFTTGRSWAPLVVLGASLAGAIACSGWASAGGGLLGEWLAQVQLPSLRGISTDRVLLLLGAMLVQLSTGNVIVRLVLAATDTVAPELRATPSDPAEQLKGGRLLGPMERVLLLGLGLAGQLTAASIVTAAKGLLRWPELQSKPEQVRIHRLTEYFLVGSFVSWLVALSALALVAR